jgi:hypothetical protein
MESNKVMAAFLQIAAVFPAHQKLSAVSGSWLQDID